MHTFSLTFGVILIISYPLPFGNPFEWNNVAQYIGQFSEHITKYADTAFKRMDTWADSIVEMAAEEECEYSCKYGKKAVQNLANQYQPIGCRSFGLKIEETYLPVDQMAQCCNKHQLCYHKCRNNKIDCDREFGKCLMAKCKNKNIDYLPRKGCETSAKFLMIGALSFGCKTFKDSQKRACVCLGSDEL